ncbi:hypothetical protein IAT40_006584 [Kwoniella sp. CBS 6097]
MIPVLHHPSRINHSITKQCIRFYATSLPRLPLNHPRPLRGADNRLTQFISSQADLVSRCKIMRDDHHDRSGHILPYVLPYEAYPDTARRADICVPSGTTGAPGGGTLLVVHMVIDSGGACDFVVSSGFVIEPDGLAEDEQIVVTCSHTLDQISLRYPREPVHSFVLVTPVASTAPIPITTYLSTSVSDLLICRVSKPAQSLRSLPVSPFPVYKGQEILVHDFQAGQETSSAWKRTEMLGYRGYSWREVMPGTSSSLPYITFSARPTSGSSGGPIVDAQSGAVVGVVSGSRTLAAVQGERGYGSSAENIFQLFNLPGFIPSSAKHR